MYDRNNFSMLLFQLGGYRNLFFSLISLVCFLAKVILRELMRIEVTREDDKNTTRKKSIHTVFFVDKALALITSFNFDQTITHYDIRG